KSEINRGYFSSNVKVKLIDPFSLEGKLIRYIGRILRSEG
ncbi:unnamed protein product, partial [marine sediment metagenome]